MAISDILRRLQERDQALDMESGGMITERRNFCIQALPQLAQDAIQQMVDTDFKSVSNDTVTELEYGENTHAAWKLADWPSCELPRQLIERYEVYLIDTGEVISLTKYWEQAGGGTEIEPYDPTRYETTTLNANTVYVVLADLPGVATFKEQNMSRMPY